MKARDLPSIEVLKRHFNYDPITGIFTHRIGRQGCAKGTLAGHFEKNGRLRLCVEGKRYLANRVAWLWIYGACENLVDHKDRDATNNAISNLRIATHTQNNWNSSGHSNKKNGLPKGIRLTGNGKKFRVTIQINGHRFSVGIFDSLVEAVSARNFVAAKHHGEFFVKEYIK